MASPSPSIPEPTNLKQLLDLLHGIDNAGIASKIAEKIRDRLKDYFPDTKDYDEFNEYLGEVLRNADKLRKLLLKNPEQCGNYNRDLFSETDACVGRCADILVKWLPKLHSEMLYLYFQTPRDFPIDGSNVLAKERVGSQDISTNLHACLSNSTAVPCITKSFDVQDLKDGFLSESLFLYTGINIFKGGPLNNIQFGLFLLDPEFQDANLAGSLLFMEEFCKEVQNTNSGMFKNVVEKSQNLNGDLSKACEKLNDNIKLYGGALINALYPQTSVKNTVVAGSVEGITTGHQETTPVVPSSRNFYSGKLKPEAAEKYAEWIKKHADSVIKKLEELHSDNCSFTGDIVDNTGLPGPFKYGFAFKEDLYDPSIYLKIQSAVDKLEQERWKEPTGRATGRSTNGTPVPKCQERGSKQQTQNELEVEGKEHEINADGEQTISEPTHDQDEQTQRNNVHSPQGNRDQLSSDAPRNEQRNNEDALGEGNKGQDVPQEVSEGRQEPEGVSGNQEVIASGDTPGHQAKGEKSSRDNSSKEEETSNKKRAEDVSLPTVPHESNVATEREAPIVPVLPERPVPTTPQNVPGQSSETSHTPSEPPANNPNEISGARNVEEPPVSLLRDNNLVSEVELPADIAPPVTQLPQNSSESSPSRLQGANPAESESSAMQLPLMPWVVLALLLIRKIF